MMSAIALTCIWFMNHEAHNELNWTFRSKFWDPFGFPKLWCSNEFNKNFWSVDQPVWSGRSACFETKIFGRNKKWSSLVKTDKRDKEEQEKWCLKFCCVPNLVITSGVLNSSRQIIIRKKFECHFFVLFNDKPVSLTIRMSCSQMRDELRLSTVTLFEWDGSDTVWQTGLQL